MGHDGTKQIYRVRPLTSERVGRSQQAQMRQAAIRAGLVPDTDAGRARVCFVTEGEASLHLCIQRGLTTPAMEVNLVALNYFQ